MATSLLLACGLNEQKLDPYIHISEDIGADGSFLISSILGQRLRTSDSSVILVCLQHTSQHYFNAGMRLGYNLNMFKDKSLKTIEPITDIALDPLNSKWITEPEKLTENLLEAIQETINEFTKLKSSITILIDNLGILLNLGADKKSLIKFCKILRNEAETNKNITIVTKLENSGIYEYIDNNLEIMSDVYVKVVKLKSGNFKEVDGKLVVSRTLLTGDYDVSKTNKEILYKVNDKNIKIFNPGEVGVKI